MNRPVGRAQPPRRPTPSTGPATVSGPPEGDNEGTTGDNGTPENGNVVDADQVYADGVTAADALDAVLGDQRTGNNQADCIAACRQIEKDTTAWEAHIVRHRERRALILHLAYNDYARRTNRPERNVWQWIAYQLRKPLATVHKWAHYIECQFVEKDQD